MLHFPHWCIWLVQIIGMCVTWLRSHHFWLLLQWWKTYIGEGNHCPPWMPYTSSNQPKKSNNPSTLFFNLLYYCISFCSAMLVLVWFVSINSSTLTIVYVPIIIKRWPFLNISIICMHIVCTAYLKLIGNISSYIYFL